MQDKPASTKFVDKGDHVELKRTVPTIQMSPKDVIEQLDAMRQNITNATAQVENMKTQIQKGEENIAVMKERAKDLEKHEEKFLKLQEAKLKAIYNNISAQAIEGVKKEYNWDKTLEDRQNRLQMYSFLQRKVATHPEVAENIAPRVHKKHLFSECFFDNPFEGYFPGERKA